MLEKGFLNEVKNLLQNPLINNNLSSMRAVGYRQAIEHLTGDISFDQFIAKGMAASRQLAKRQLTWLRAMPSRTIIDPSEQSFVHQGTKTCLEHILKFKLMRPIWSCNYLTNLETIYILRL